MRAQNKVRVELYTTSCTDTGHVRVCVAGCTRSPQQRTRFKKHTAGDESETKRNTHTHTENNTGTSPRYSYAEVNKQSQKNTRQTGTALHAYCCMIINTAVYCCTSPSPQPGPSPTAGSPASAPRSRHESPGDSSRCYHCYQWPSPSRSWSS